MTKEQANLAIELLRKIEAHVESLDTIMRISFRNHEAKLWRPVRQTKTLVLQTSFVLFNDEASIVDFLL